MSTYSESDLIRVGRRYGNAKRGYILIDPLQAKHLPVSPTAALQMMHSLGQLLRDAVPDAGCIIGFAETATAISGAAALAFPDDTLFLHTTREFPADRPRMLRFFEEHSHAVNQQLDCSRLCNADAGSIILLDDELTTGKTMRNMITAMQEKLPAMRRSGFHIGSVLNRIPADIRAEFAEMGIGFTALCEPHGRDFEDEAAQFTVRAPQPVSVEMRRAYRTVTVSGSRLAETRTGLTVRQLTDEMNRMTRSALAELGDEPGSDSRILVLGTEECMLPAMMLGAAIEQQTKHTVRCHATTRSPIGVSDAADYPIREGWQIASFYENSRVNYLYNPDQYDLVIVVTDSRNDAQIPAAMQQLMQVFSERCRSFRLVRC